MPLLKAPTVACDSDFEYVGNVAKADTLPDGRRIVRGVASGVSEDADGERVSARAIARMVTESQAAIRKGQLPLTSSHTQDWVSEFADVVRIEHDKQHDELIVDAILPPQGEDPIADKAWKSLTKDGKKLGFSIGGKLKSAYFEHTETGKRRKVLDHIGLKHVMLTEHPSYRQSFAQAVAKSFTGDAPDLSAFTEEVDLAAERAEADSIIAKASAPSPGKPGKDEETPDDDQPQPTAGTAETTAGPGDDAPDDSPQEPPSDAEETAKLPLAQRHLSCPSCGHEFAADLPAEDVPDDDTNDDEDGAGEAPKSKEKPDMSKSVEDTLSAIRDLVENATVAKAATPEPVHEDEPSDVMKMVAASHAHAEERIDTLTQRIETSFGAVEKALSGIVERLAAQPVGRQSVARVLPTGPESAAQVAKSLAENGASPDLGAPEVLAKANEEASTSIDVFKNLNAARGVV